MIYRVGGLSFTVDGPADDPNVRRVHRNFAGLRTGSAPADLALSVLTRPPVYRLLIGGVDKGIDIPPAELIYEIEGEVVVRAQLKQPEWVYLHAAALASGNRAVLLVGESGAGKSTFCWALTHFGFRYLSDELAPLSPTGVGFEVEPYRHALCLKRPPPSRFGMPDSAFFSGRTWHIPVSAMPGGDGHPSSADRPLLTHIVFVDRNAGLATEGAALSTAAIVHRMYPQILNALAHPRKGLQVATSIARSTQGLVVDSQDLERACRTVCHLVDSSDERPA